MHLRRAHKRRLVVPSFFGGFHQDKTYFSFSSHMSPIGFHFHTSHKALWASQYWILVFNLWNFSSLCFLRLSSNLFSKSLANILCLPLVVHHYSYRNSKGHLWITLYILGVSYPFVNTHSNESLCPSMDPMFSSKLMLPLTIMCLGLTCPFPCELSCVDHCNFACVCRWGILTYPVCPCCRG